MTSSPSDVAPVREELTDYDICVRSEISCSATMPRILGSTTLSATLLSFFYPGDAESGGAPEDAAPVDKVQTKSTIVLAVDDSEDDLFLLRRAIEKSEVPFLLRTVKHGDAAIEYLTGEGKYADRDQYPLPSTMFLDLKMPGRNGFEFLTWYRSQDVVKDLNIVVLSGSGEDRDIRRAQSLGVDKYLVKPPTAQMVRRVLEN